MDFDMDFDKDMDMDKDMSIERLWFVTLSSKNKKMEEKQTHIRTNEQTT
jgi:hypothetical protein